MIMNRKWIKFEFQLKILDSISCNPLESCEHPKIPSRCSLDPWSWLLVSDDFLALGSSCRNLFFLKFLKLFKLYSIDEIVFRDDLFQSVRMTWEENSWPRLSPINLRYCGFCMASVPAWGLGQLWRRPWPTTLTTVGGAGCRCPRSRTLKACTAHSVCFSWWCCCRWRYIASIWVPIGCFRSRRCGNWAINRRVNLGDRSIAWRIHWCCWRRGWRWFPAGKLRRNGCQPGSFTMFGIPYIWRLGWWWCCVWGCMWRRRCDRAVGLWFDRCWAGRCDRAIGPKLGGRRFKAFGDVKPLLLRQGSTEKFGIARGTRGLNPLSVCFVCLFVFV